MIALEIAFWVVAGALAWTHVALPARGAGARAGCARARCRRTRRRSRRVAVIVTAYNEEPVIERRIENLRALDYPRGPARARRHLRRVVGRTEALAEARRRARDPQSARWQGRGAEQRGPRRPTGEIVAFSDANSTWAPDALRTARAQLRRPRRRIRVRPAEHRSRTTGATRRASTGGTSSRCAPTSRGSTRSPAATARSTRCAARTTSRSTRASATTSRCRI